jgi:hypothetical protein
VAQVVVNGGTSARLSSFNGNDNSCEHTWCGMVSLPLKLESLTVHCLLHGQVHRPPPMQEPRCESSLPCSSECLVALFELCLVVERVHRCIVAERLLFVLLLTQSSNQCKHVQTMGSHSYLSGFCATMKIPFPGNFAFCLLFRLHNHENHGLTRFCADFNIL